MDPSLDDQPGSPERLASFLANHQRSLSDPETLSTLADPGSLESLLQAPCGETPEEH